MGTDIRQNPTPEWIASVRAKYDVEPAVDRALTRKLEQRSGPAYTPASLDDVSERLRSFLAKQIDGSFHLGELSALSGGASKEQFVFTLEWTAEGRTYKDRMVMRRNPREGVLATDLTREFQLIRAFEGRIPVPKTYWYDPLGAEMEQPTIIYGFAPGVQKPKAGSGNVSGIGTFFGPELRSGLGEDFVRHLGAIHTMELDPADLSAFNIPVVGSSEATRRSINWWARVWEEDRIEEVPLMTVAEQWLRANIPTLDHASVVHGDYRSGNFLFDEKHVKITAILDWEMGSLGDRHADLAWTLFEPFSTKDESGNTLICGLLPRKQFLDMYEQSSGLSVDPARLTYFSVFALWRCIMIAGTSSLRAANGLKTHQNVMLTWVAGMGYALMDSLRRILEEEG